MSPEQFALVKTLFDQVCDLPEDEREQRVTAVTDDLVVIREVLNLASSGSLPTGRFAGSVREAMEQVSAGRSGSGSVLGAWTLGEEIGHGGMGRVFKASRSDGHFEQAAAVKLLSGLASPAALDHLARERQILASLSHPHIARLLDGGSTPQGQPYLVMEYVDGLSIDRYCASRNLGTAAILQLFDAVCAAVAFAHQQLVVHCDLKPSNILVCAGRPVLLDFGVSSLLGEAAAGLGAQLVADGGDVRDAAYTPRYASPEQKARLRVGTATDVYSLGLVLAELLGAWPPEEESPALDALPRDLAAVVAQAIRPDPAGRYAGVDAFAADLGRYQRREPVAARASTPLYRAQKWTSRHWPWLAAAALFLAVIAAFSWRMRVERDSALAAERAALAVKDYMISVFQGADPEVSGRRDLPVSALLDAGRDGLETRLRDQPLVRAEISGILGSVYQTIGRREQALHLFDAAVEAERGSARPLMLAALLHKRAYTSYDMEDFAQAEPIAREALALREHHAPESAALVDSLRLLGTIVLYLDRREEAQALLARALEMSIRVSGEDSVETARVHLDFGRFHGYLDPVATGAIAHARRAQQIIGRELGADHILYADALEILVLGLATTQAYDEAVPIARELSEKRLKLYGEISYQGGYGLYTYANLLNEAGRRAEAVPLLERCLVIQEQLDGKDALSSTTPLQLLARVQEGLGNYEAALELFAQIAAIRDRLGATTGRDTLELRAHAGRIRREQGKLPEAQALLQEVLQARRDDPSTHPYRMLQSQLELAALRRLQGRLDEAEATIAAIDVAAIADAPWQRGFIDAERARIVAARGNVEDAITALTAAEDLIAKGLGETHPDLWLLRMDRAELLLRAGRFQAARELADRIGTGAAPSMAAGGDHVRRLKALKDAAAR